MNSIHASSVHLPKNCGTAENKIWNSGKEDRKFLVERGGGICQLLGSMISTGIYFPFPVLLPDFLIS